MFNELLKRVNVFFVALLFIATEFAIIFTFPAPINAASEVFRVTTYEYQIGVFTGTTHTLVLNNDLATDYYTMVSGASSATATRAANEDSVRVSGDPHGNFGSTTNANEIQLSRNTASNNWIGAVTVVECLIDCLNSGFVLREVIETSLPAGTANSQQTVTANLAQNHSSNTVPIGGKFGGGLSTSSNDANDYSVTMGIKISKINTNQIQFDRFGGEGRVPAAADVTTYVVEWGSTWGVQDVTVTGTASGTGLDATSEYNSTAINPVSRSNTWVWGTGFTRDDGLGDGALGQVIALGDGVNQNTTETVVSVGSEAGVIAPGRNFEIYVLENSLLTVEHQFRPRGDQGPASGFQELDLTISSPIDAESYDNLATDIQFTEGTRFPLFYSTSAGTGQAYSRPVWALRIDANTNVNYWRSYAGQVVTGWMQIVDFGDVEFSNVDTQQQSYRWRDDTTDLNTSGGWLESENTNLTPQAKNTNLRLRMRVANHGTTPEDAARTYELQFALKEFSCGTITTWTGVSDNPNDAFSLYDSPQISPDGESITAGLLDNSDGFTFVNGEAREASDTTGAIGPMSTNTYTELEYAIRPTDNAVTGSSYCFRLYDTTALDELESYIVYPELSIESVAVTTTGLGEAGTFSSAVDGGWTTINFIGSYTTPVVVGTTNSHNGESALVFESRNVTSTSAEMRVCESEGATVNGCDTHASETVGYMVIDASVAATIDGIEAGTFTASGNSDSNSVTTNFVEAFSTTPYVFANVNTVNSSEFPIEVVIPSTSNTSFSAGICDHLQGNNDECDPAHGNETVGWVAIDPSNVPFEEDHDSGIVSIGNSTWTPISFTTSFSSVPVLISASQTDTGGQDVEIDEARNVSTTGAEIRYCEIDTLDNCDNHNPDDVAWFAIESGEFTNTIEVDQDGFRFYENVNNITPTIALAGENSSIANVDDGDVLRLRMALQVGQNSVPTGDFSIKLQFGEGLDCSAIGVWNDVGGLGSGSIWRGFNNSTPSDGSTIPSSVLDSGSNSLQTYEEENNSSPNPNTINSGSRGEWDWVIQNNNANDFTSYCFRAVTSENDIVNYTRYAQLTTSSGVPNLAPNNPSNLVQEKFSTMNIAVGEVINETTVVFQADVSDQNTNDILQLCVEVKRIGVSFVGTEDACGPTVVYSGSTLEASISITGFEHNVSYHWQARVRDAAGLYSSWVSFGGNPESDSDFSVDTVAPSVIVYDGITTGVDIEYNGGELDELSANWEKIDGISPSDLGGLTLWLDGEDVNGTGVDPANGDPITTWVDKSGNSNDINGTGAATFDSGLQAVAFSDDVQPFDDNYDRSGGNINSQTIFAVVTGNATVSNHVWYETTTPRVSPAENGLLGGGTSLTNNNNWSSHITDKAMFTVEYLSTGTSTAWLNNVEEYQFTETQVFADTQRMVIGDDTTGGNRLETGEYVHEIVLYNEDLSASDRENIWEHLRCKWDINDCSVTYEYSIGTSPGASDIASWTSTGSSESIVSSGLNLQTTEVYYVNVRATDLAGNQTVSSSDGQLVAPTLSFTVSGGSIEFNNLNSANSYTDTQNTIVTTSTNARGGYEIRAHTTGFLESPTSGTINMFDGGTYAAPDEWLPGDTGLGYTSSDSLVQGTNLFLPATCIGGGSGPCYAPYSTLPPGDIVADNQSAVAGTPISNESFTITHRVTTSSDQLAGNYQTLIIFTVAAKY